MTGISRDVARSWKHYETVYLTMARIGRMTDLVLPHDGSLLLCTNFFGSQTWSHANG